MKAPEVNQLGVQRFQVAVCLVDRIVAHRVYEPGSDVTIGRMEANLVVTGWEGPTLTLISGGTLLHLQPGMRLSTNANAGGSCVTPRTFEELQADGVELPMRVENSKLNILIRAGVSVFVKYLGDGEAEWQPPPDDGAARPPNGG